MKWLNTLRFTTILFEKKNPLLYIFTKSLQDSRNDYICNKFGTYNLYSLTWESVLNMIKILLNIYILLLTILC